MMGKVKQSSEMDTWRLIFGYGDGDLHLHWIDLGGDGLDERIGWRIERG